MGVIRRTAQWVAKTSEGTASGAGEGGGTTGSGTGSGTGVVAFIAGCFGFGVAELGTGPAGGAGGGAVGGAAGGTAAGASKGTFSAVVSTAINVVDTIISCVPPLNFAGQLLLGRAEDCWNEDGEMILGDNDKDSCINGRVAVSLDLNPLNVYFYSEISSISFGALFRSVGLGAVLEAVPEAMVESGFSDNLISFAMLDHPLFDINLLIEAGLKLKGTLTILGWKGLTVDVDIVTTLFPPPSLFINISSSPLELGCVPELDMCLVSLQRNPWQSDLGPTAWIAARLFPPQFEFLISGHVRLLGHGGSGTFSVGREGIIGYVGLEGFFGLGSVEVLVELYWIKINGLRMPFFLLPPPLGFAFETRRAHFSVKATAVRDVEKRMHDILISLANKAERDAAQARSDVATARKNMGSATTFRDETRKALDIQEEAMAVGQADLAAKTATFNAARDTANAARRDLEAADQALRDGFKPLSDAVCQCVCIKVPKCGFSGCRMVDVCDCSLRDICNAGNAALEGTKRAAQSTFDAAMSAMNAAQAAMNAAHNHVYGTLLPALNFANNMFSNVAMPAYYVAQGALHTAEGVLLSVEVSLSHPSRGRHLCVNVCPFTVLISSLALLAQTVAGAAGRVFNAMNSLFGALDGARLIEIRALSLLWEDSVATVAGVMNFEMTFDWRAPLLGVDEFSPSCLVRVLAEGVVGVSHGVVTLIRFLFCSASILEPSRPRWPKRSRPCSLTLECQIRLLALPGRTHSPHDQQRSLRISPNTRLCSSRRLAPHAIS